MSDTNMTTLPARLRERKKWIRDRYGLTGETLAQERELEEDAALAGEERK